MCRRGFYLRLTNTDCADAAMGEGGKLCAKHAEGRCTVAVLRCASCEGMRPTCKKVERCGTKCTRRFLLSQKYAEDAMRKGKKRRKGEGGGSFPALIWKKECGCLILFIRSPAPVLFCPSARLFLLPAPAAAHPAWLFRFAVPSCACAHPFFYPPAHMRIRPPLFCSPQKIVHVP